jgi:hypothetical protein
MMRNLNVANCECRGVGVGIGVGIKAKAGVGPVLPTSGSICAFRNHDFLII